MRRRRCPARCCRGTRCATRNSGSGWTQHGAIPDAVGTRPVVAYDAGLLDGGTTEGLFVAWERSTSAEDDLIAQYIQWAVGEIGLDGYDDLHRWSAAHRDDFWRHTIDRLGVVFSRPADEVLDLSNGPAQPEWFRVSRILPHHS